MSRLEADVTRSSAVDITPEPRSGHRGVARRGRRGDRGVRQGPGDDTAGVAIR
ncbi:hypothetical protein ABXN37_26455 [Piscinibacter sakaiensis]|uniref:hypothetical protein n=1 Tax=Piscinibacter sakaiensis TaxID=1547922 RepID=UPI003727DE8F